MIGLDTNVLLRLGDDDEPVQRDRARARVRSQGANGCFVNAIVLAEFAWTLTRGPADFADYFLAEINTSAGCAMTATFDRDALKSGEPFASVPTGA